MEFAYNNTYQSSIQMAPFEALYCHNCRSPICWFKVSERRLIGPKIVEDASELVQHIRDQMTTA